MLRAGKEVDLIGRINGFFQRTMNGKPVPCDSEKMEAMIAYMEWLAQNAPKDQLVDIRNAGVIDDEPRARPAARRRDILCPVLHLSR